MEISRPDLFPFDQIWSRNFRDHPEILNFDLGFRYHYKNHSYCLGPKIVNPKICHFDGTILKESGWIA